VAAGRTVLTAREPGNGLPMSDPPLIGDYALLGDSHGAAMVSRDGSIDWWCAQRFDAPSIFARLLDADGGHWSVRPVGDYDVERHYVGDTLVMRTRFSTRDGVLELTDGLALGAGERGHEIGYRSPHALLRLVETVQGEVEVEVEFSPRPEYGLITPQFAQSALGLEVSGGADLLVLSSERELVIGDGGATARFLLRSGESVMSALQHERPHPSERAAPLDGRRALADTIAGWESWAELHHSYEGPFAEQVRRSALVLQALTFQPTGAVVAAPTTSLPEVVGGSANWDYRFGWLRDGSLTLKALWVAACPDEAERFFDWITRAAGPAVEGDHVQIMFGVDGEHDLTEHDLPHLSGHRDSAPVRVGNDAWDQKQLDVLGEVLESAWVLRDQLDDLRPLTRSFLASLADRAAASWREKDAGIWEGREGLRDYLTSKLMCWVALDRAIKLAPKLGDSAAPERWKPARDEIRTAILERGWSESAGAYSGAFGSDHLDAGVLLMPIMGFLPATDERMAATIDAIERDLSHDGLVQRWTGSGDEGAFVICSYWLAACRALAGEVGRAEEIFEAVTSHANDLGLLSEEIDIHDGRLLGNFPQGLSHIGLINCAWAIGQAQSSDVRGDR
jgi:GH15 family glucan-1,4-alpha-glucosidase